MSKRRHSEENIYSSAVIQALEQEYCSSCSAAVVSSCCLVSSHGLGARVMSRIYHGGRQAVYTATVAAMLVQNMAVPAYGAAYTVSAGETSSGLVTQYNSNTPLNVYGTTNNTIVSSGGQEILYSGGVANGTTVNSGGTQSISNGGIANSAVVNGSGWQVISAGGVANSAIINSRGYQIVENGGLVTNTVINEMGQQFISSGGVANSAIINPGGYQDVLDGGVATNTVINGGWQDLSSGGVAISTTINEGGFQWVEQGTLASDTVVNSGGVLFVTQGQAYNVIQNSGGNISATIVGGDSSTYISGINQNGEAFVLQNGIASNFIVNDDLIVSSGGVAKNTVINRYGFLDIGSTAVASDTIVNSQGELRVSRGAQAYNVIQNSGGRITAAVYGGDSSTFVSGTNQNGDTFTLQNGVASNFILNYWDDQHVRSGGIASGTIISNGGYQAISSGSIAQDTVVYGGPGFTLKYNQVIFSGGTANNTIISSGGIQGVSSGGVASNTIIYTDGVQQVLAGGSAVTTLVSGGTQNVSSGGFATDTTLYSGGIQNIYSGANVSNTVVSGCTVNLYEGGNLNGYAGSSGDLNIYGNGAVTGNMQVAGTAAVHFKDATATQRLNVDHLNANGAVLNMNVDLMAQTADQLKVNSSYTGSANIAVTNVASGAQATTSDGIKLVEFASGAAITSGADFGLVGGQYDEGGYVYTLNQGTVGGVGQDYYLRSTSAYTDTFKTMLNIPVMNVMLARTGMASLQKRLGDLQQMDNVSKKSGVWVRSYYKDMRVSDLVDTDMNLFGAEAGYDWLFRAEEPTKLYAGVLLGYIDATNIKTKTTDNRYEKGKGTAPSVGVYATLVNDDRWFVDIAARNFWTKLDMTNHASDGTKMDYEPERNVFTASIEGGKSFVSELSRDRFVRIEPKVEVNYLNAGGESTEVKNGVGELKYESANYLNAKAGILLGYNIKRDNGLLLEPLLEVAYRQEFLGKGDISYGGAKEQSNLKGGNVEVNLGLNMQLTDSLYWYGLGSYEAGEKVKGWGVNAGIRYAFGGKKTPKAKKNKATEQKQPKAQKTRTRTTKAAKKSSQAKSQPAAEQHVQKLSDKPAVSPTQKSVRPSRAAKNQDYSFMKTMEDSWKTKE